MSAADLVGWVPFLALLATMPVFAIAARGRPRDHDVARRGASVLLGYWLRDWMIWVLSPLERLLVRGEVSPDVVNYAAALLGLLAGAAFVAGQLPLAAWLIALGGVGDILDGRIARARGLASAYGAFIDSTLDRFAETFTFIGVAWYLAGTTWMAAATVLAVGGSLLVSYTRARGEALGVLCTRGIFQRAERLVVLALASLLDPSVTQALGWGPGTVLAGAVVVIGFGTFGTACYRIRVIGRTLANRAYGTEVRRGGGTEAPPGRETEPAVRG